MNRPGRTNWKMALKVKLEAFEGPLDLLLHLIDLNKVDIYDIPIAVITEQYLEYIRELDTEDMNISSEFLVMAATLLDIKCRMLLPRETDENGEELDPRQELVEKLLEYKMYRYMSEELREKRNAASRELYRGKKIPKEVAAYMPPVNYEELIGDTTLAALGNIFADILKRQKYRVDPIRSGFGVIEREEVDISSRQTFIRAYLKEHKTASFRSLLEHQKSKKEVIVTFLVVLELMKLGSIEIRQEDNFGEITIEAVGEFSEALDLEKEYG